MSQGNDVISFRGKDLVDMSKFELIGVINELASRESSMCEDHSRCLEKLVEFRRQSRVPGLLERILGV